MGLPSDQKNLSQPRWKAAMRAVGWFLLDQWFLIAMALLIVISSQVQVPLDKQQLRQTIVTYLSVAIIFFVCLRLSTHCKPSTDNPQVTGCNLKTRVLIENYTRWRVHLYIQLQCFLMCSAIVFGIVSAAATNPDFMDPAMLIGLIFLGVVPTTLSSNVVMTGQAGGNTALTVVQTTIGNFIGPFISPLLIKLYISTGAWYTEYLQQAEAEGGGFGEIYKRVFMQLGFSVYLPLVVGQVVQNLFPHACDTVFNKWHGKKIGSIALLSIIWQTFDQAFATGAFSSVKPSNIIFIVFINIALFGVWLAVALSTSIPWLPRKDVISVAYCVPAKTPAMGVPLSNVMFAGLSLLTESKMQVPMILFQGLQITFSSLMTIPLRWWVQNEERKRQAEEKARESERGTTSSSDPGEGEEHERVDNKQNGDEKIPSAEHDMV